MRRILVVNNEHESAELLCAQLRPEGHHIQVATDAEAALHRLRAWKPHLMILDDGLARESREVLIAKLRGYQSEGEYVAVILLSKPASREELAKQVESGADDCVIKPFHREELIMRVRTMMRFKESQDALKRANHRIEELSVVDEQTSLLRMPALFRRGQEEVLRCKRFKKPVSALVINLDGFSGINQNQGFLFGNQVLREVAQEIKGCLHSVDLIAHVSADEFFVLLTEIDLAGAEFMAERVRDAIQSRVYKNEKMSARLTASIGVAWISAEQVDHQLSDLVHFTFEALRSAKTSGANRIEVYSFA